MAKERIEYTEHFPEVMAALSTRGLLLGSMDKGGKPNLMTIGWGAIGTVWSKPLWTVLVRHSRHTLGCIEAHGAFTVNVPGPDMAAVCELCGRRSGRDTDKFAACGLTPEKSSIITAPGVAECAIVYECRVVHSNELLPERLQKEIVQEYYPRGDFHRVYWGEILEVRADRQAAARLGD